MNRKKSQKTPSNEPDRYDAEEVFRRRPDFFEKHLKGAPNLKAVRALLKKEK